MYTWHLCGFTKQCEPQYSVKVKKLNRKWSSWFGLRCRCRCRHPSREFYRCSVHPLSVNRPSAASAAEVSQNFPSQRNWRRRQETTEMSPQPSRPSCWWCGGASWSRRWSSRYPQIQALVWRLWRRRGNIQIQWQGTASELRVKSDNSDLETLHSIISQKPCVGPSKFTNLTHDMGFWTKLIQSHSSFN